MASQAAAKPKVVTEDGEPVVHFDLDAVENEAVEAPFVFVLGGETFTMANPQDADWQVQDDLTSAGGLHSYVRELIGPADFDRFCEHKVSGRMLTRLFERCQEHYGITVGESAASGRSLRSTRRQ